MRRRRTGRRAARSVLSSVIAVVLVGGCGGPTNPAPGTATAASTTGFAAPGRSTGLAGSSGTGRASRVAVADGVLGMYLVDSEGRTLYVFDGDATETATCLDACAVAWPPLLTGGAPTAAEGAAGGPLTTTTRPDGSRQVVYDRHPLYFSATDTAPGQITGQGSGGTWWIIGPDARPIRSAAGSASPTPTTG